MGFPVSITYDTWTIVTIVSSVVGALGTVAVFITYLHLKEKYNHELEKEDEKRKIDYRLLVLKHLGPLLNFFTEEYRTNEDTLDQIIKPLQGNHKNFDLLCDWIGEQIVRIYKKTGSYVLYSTDFPITNSILFSLFFTIGNSIKELRKNLPQLQENKEVSIDEVIRNTKGLYLSSIRYSGFHMNRLLRRSPESLWRLHRIEIEEGDRLFLPKSKKKVYKNMATFDIIKYSNFFCRLFGRGDGCSSMGDNLRNYYDNVFENEYIKERKNN